MPMLSQVSVLDVTREANTLKCNKHDAVFSLSPNAFKEGRVALSNHISVLLTTSARFEHVPNKIIICFMWPLIKGIHGDICSSTVL